ncbi:hypothetical protein IGV50_004408 [Salmonella enterica subsp. enterica serovar Newport]|nr:hypothetical protein [Salmonella enterica subsp. enterica serovar Newport]
MSHLEKYPNLTNGGKGRPKGSKNKYSQENLIKQWAMENNTLINWLNILDKKITNDMIRPEAIAPAFEKVAKYVVRTVADQDVLDIVAPDTEDDINRDLDEINQELALIESLRKR